MYVSDVPLHVPVEVVSVAPSTAEPEMSGSAVFTGAVCAVTTAVWADWALVAPSGFVAVSSTRSVEPTSPGATTWVCPVSPAIAAQPAPTASQRSHASAKPIGGVPVQEPETAVSVSPETAVPLMVGGDALAGVAASAPRRPRSGPRWPPLRRPALHST